MKEMPAKKRRAKKAAPKRSAKQKPEHDQADDDDGLAGAGSERATGTLTARSPETTEYDTGPGSADIAADLGRNRLERATGIEPA